MLMIRNIDLYVQIPGLSDLYKNSRSGIQMFKFQDFQGFQGPVQTLFYIFVMLKYVKTHTYTGV